MTDERILRLNELAKKYKSGEPLTDEELKDGTNWELCNTNEESGKEYINHKAIPIARVISRG